MKSSVNREGSAEKNEMPKRLDFIGRGQKDSMEIGNSRYV